MSRNEFTLFRKVTELSQSKNWEEARKEWETIKITEVDKEEDYGSCICGKYPIKEMIQLFNSKNHNEIIVGNCCINKFFGIKEYNKVFNAIKKGKVNKKMIEEAYKNKIINDWENTFMLDVWRKRSFSEKQEECYKKIKEKILNSFK